MAKVFPKIEEKEISSLRLITTNQCNCHCQNCLIEKGNNMMPLKTAKRAVDILLTSNANNKILMLYGGEPMMNFPLLKKIIEYSRKKEKKHAPLIISLATNGLLLEKKHIFFFKDNDVKISVSFVGKRTNHDKRRKFFNGLCTYSTLFEKTKTLLRNMPEENVSCLFCIYPKTAGAMLQNFKHLLKIGFRNFNFECIENTPWDKQQLATFTNRFNRASLFILQQIKKGNFIFLSSVTKNLLNNQLDCKQLARLNFCLFSKPGLQVYPDGTFGFYPPVSNKLKNKIIIGDINKNFILRKYATCKFDSTISKCIKCKSSYNSRLPKPIGQEPYYIRNKISGKIAKKILAKSTFNENFKKYAKCSCGRRFEP